MKKSLKNPKKSPSRRSPCPVACALDILGDRWTLLVVRDLLLGRSRFKEIVSSPENLPTNLLTDRLNRLTRHGIIKSTASSDGTKHMAYQLTDKGRALGPILKSLRDWGLQWINGTELRIEAKK